MKGLNGHVAIDKDKGKVSYDYSKVLPFVVQGLVPVELVDKWRKEGRDAVVYTAPSISQLQLRGLNKDGIDEVVVKLEEVLEDLKAISVELSN